MRSRSLLALVLAYAAIVLPAVSQAESKPAASREADSRAVSRRTSKGVAYTVVQQTPHAGEVIDTAVEPILKTGLPWKIRLTEIDLVLVLVPPGEGTVGAVAADTFPGQCELPACKVVVTRPLWVGESEVTNAQFRAHDRAFPKRVVSDASIAETRPLPAPDSAVPIWGRDLPVTMVTWKQAVGFCDRFKVRLPTELEWEYACRFTTRSMFTWGDEVSAGAGFENLLDAQGALATKRHGSFPWDDGFRVMAPGCRFRRNVLGLCDMGGNVCEWCSDDFDSRRYELGAVKSVHQPHVVRGSAAKVVRGGSWATGAWQARVSGRREGSPIPEGGDPEIGFRVVLDP